MISTFCTPSIFFASPMSVPPPTPVPPRYSILSPDAWTSAVPVPMLTMTASGRPVRYKPPRPVETNSLTCSVFSP